MEKCTAEMEKPQAVNSVMENNSAMQKPNSKLLHFGKEDRVEAALVTGGCNSAFKIFMVTLPRLLFVHINVSLPHGPL